MDNIRLRTRRHGFSRGAVEGFLDFAQAIDLMFKTIAYQTSTDRADPRQSAIPEIKLMSWKEWERIRLETDGYTKCRSAIDVLIDEYKGLGGSNSSSFLQPKIHNDTTARESRQSLNRGQASLPTRIRINSLPAQYLLSSIFDIEGGPNRLIPLVFVRPFKVLALHIEEINAKMDEINLLLTERRKEQELSEVTADEALQPSNDPDGTSGHNNGPRQGDEDACSIVEHAKGDDISNVEAQSPRRSSFRDNMFAFTGTNLAEFNLSIIEEAANDFRCVVDFVNETLQPVRSYLRNEPSSVNFNNIWHLFVTGSLVYIKDRSTPQKIWKVIQATGGRRYLDDPGTGVPDWETKWSPFVVDCYYLDFDGTNFMRVNRQFTIERFNDSMPIAGLQIMPLAVAERLLSDVNRDEFRERGEQFLAFLTPQHRYYQGTTLTQSPCGNTLFTQNKSDYDSHRLFIEQVESHVVVDFARGIQASPDWAPPSREVDLWKSDSAEFEDEAGRIEMIVERDNMWDSRVSEEFSEKEEIKRQRWNKNDEKPEGDDLLLLPGRVFAYILRTRSWGKSTTSSLTEDIVS
jgi:hypothetical protein